MNKEQIKKYGDSIASENERISHDLDKLIDRALLLKAHAHPDKSFLIHSKKEFDTKYTGENIIRELHYIAPNESPLFDSRPMACLNVKFKNEPND